MEATIEQYDIIVNLEGTLMERNLPILEFKICNGKLIFKAEHLENASFYYDLWVVGEVSEKNLQDFLLSRVPRWHRPSGTYSMPKQLTSYKIEQYLQKSHGITMHDDFWIRFPGEEHLQWDNLR